MLKNEWLPSVTNPCLPFPSTVQVSTESSTRLFMNGVWNKRYDGPWTEESITKGPLNSVESSARDFKTARPPFVANGVSIPSETDSVQLGTSPLGDLPISEKFERGAGNLGLYHLSVSGVQWLQGDALPVCQGHPFRLEKVFPQVAVYEYEFPDVARLHRRYHSKLLCS